MTDLDLITKQLLSALTEKLRANDPLGVPVDTFIEQSLKRVKGSLSPKPENLQVKYVIDKLHEVTQNKRHKVLYKSVGTVQHIGNGIARLSGLPLVHLDELVSFPNGTQGMVLNLDRKSVTSSSSDRIPESAEETK